MSRFSDLGIAKNSAWKLVLGENLVKNTCFSHFRNGFQDIQVYALCTAHGKPVKEKEKA